MTDLSFPDRLPHELEPTGAVQTTCSWAPAGHSGSRWEPGYETTCGVRVYHEIERGWTYCPHCGAKAQVAEAAL